MKERVTPHNKESLIIKKHFRIIGVIVAVILVSLPFITTFNELLTAGIMKIEAYNLIQNIIVPYEVKMVAVLLKALGIYSQVSQSSIYIKKGSELLGVFISWNCIGWQSVILFAITLITGLQGPYTVLSKAQTVIVGFLGTFVVNIFRVTLVTLFAYFFGQLPAIIFHDYGSTIMIILWLLLFWYVSYTFILERKKEDVGTAAIPN